MNYHLLSTGSDGNCLILEGKIAVDMGVSYRSLSRYTDSLQLVLLTHVHHDHFNHATVNRLMETRPSLRFAVPPWLYFSSADSIDVCAMDTWYDYGGLRIMPFELYHDVENCGWKIEYQGKRIIYATDTRRIDHVEAYGYDYYFIEANYTENEILERIAAKEANGEFVYEYRAMQTHLSREKADAWLMANARDDSLIEYLHGHVE